MGDNGALCPPRLGGDDDDDEMMAREKTAELCAERDAANTLQFFCFVFCLFSKRKTFEKQFA